MLNRHRQNEDAAIMTVDDIEALAESVRTTAHRQVEERLAAARRERVKLVAERAPIFFAWNQQNNPRIPAELAAIDGQIAALEAEIRTLRTDALGKRAHHAAEVAKVTESTLAASSASAMAALSELRTFALMIDAIGAIRERHHGAERGVELARLVDDLEQRVRRWAPR